MTRDDTATVCAIAVLAMCVATTAHEAVGHGAACLLAGGRITRVTSVYFNCAGGDPYASIGGPLGNLAAAVLAWIGLRALPATAARAKLFALLLVAIDLFWMAGQSLYEMVRADGDYFYGGLSLFGEPTQWWRAVAILPGVALYLGGVRLVRHEAGRFLERTRPVLRTAWFAATAFAVAAATFFTCDTTAAMGQAFLEIGAASIPLLMIDRIEETADTDLIARSTVWIASAALVFLIFAATLGRGLP